VLVVTVDVHERTSGIPEMLRALGVQVDVRALKCGDYVVGTETLVERKTVLDLHRSVAAGRFWAQMKKIRTAGMCPCLVIEGASLYEGPVPADAVRGLCLAVADLGVIIIRTESRADTSESLLRIAARRRDGAVRHRPVYAQRPRSTTTSPQEAALASAPGISVTTARTVLARYGSLSQLSDASAADLKDLPGIGPKRADAIVALIHDRWRTRSAN
jgi:DNA excision repair protein ERCC-4